MTVSRGITLSTFVRDDPESTKFKDRILNQIAVTLKTLEHDKDSPKKTMVTQELLDQKQELENPDLNLGDVIRLMKSFKDMRNQTGDDNHGD